jgi:tetratricopeptide (TPR) repeat protein
VLQALDRDEEAKAQHLKASALQGKFGSELLELAYQGPDGFALAIERARSVNIDEDELTSLSWLICGKMLTLGDEPARGAAALQKGIEMENAPDRSTWWPYRDLGLALLAAGRQAEAREVFETAKGGCDACTAAYFLGSMTDKQYVNNCCGLEYWWFPWFYVGRLADAEGRIDDAIAAYEKALEFWWEPETELLRFNAARYRLQVLRGERPRSMTENEERKSDD